MATLKLNRRVKGKIRGKSQDFMGEEFTLGRSPDSDIQILNELADEEHAKILYDPTNQNFVLQDERSLSGTYINGVAIEQRHPLESDDKLVIADQVYTVQWEKDNQLLQLILETHTKGRYVLEELDGLPQDRRWRYIILFMTLALGFFVPLVVLPMTFTAEEVWTVGPLHKVHLDKNGQPLACSKCHVPVQGVTNNKCGQCHVDQSEKDLHLELKKNCTECHLDHQGRSGVITQPVANSSCRSCHEDAHAEEDMGPSLVHLKPKKTTKLLRYPSYSHAEHLKAGLKCADCHEVGKKRWQDFEPVTYRSCVECHDHRDWAVKDHGSKRCLQCHDTATSGRWKMEEKERPVMVSFTMTNNHHGAEAKDCRRCHISGKVQLKPKLTGTTFPHGLHLKMAEANSKMCLLCHSPQGQSTAVQRLNTRELCGKCHEGTISLNIQPRKISSVPFDHSYHVAHIFSATKGNTDGEKRLKQRGCASCHKVNSSGELDRLPSRQVCLDCHQNHDNMAEVNDCRKCHQGLSDLFKKGGGQIAQVRLSLDRFRHKYPTHRKMECTQCHLDMDKAENLLQVKLPKIDNKVCARCHETPAGSLAGSESGEFNLENCTQCHHYHKKSLKDMRRVSDNK